MMKHVFTVTLTAISHEGFGSDIDEYKKVYSNPKDSLESLKRKFSLEFGVPLDDIKESISGMIMGDMK